MVGVIGRSGAGKPTLLRLINRLIEPTQGTIHYRDATVSAFKGRQLHAWRARCAMIFQQFNLVNRLDVLTNVLIGRLNYHWTLPTLVKCFSAAERALAIRALEGLDIQPQALQRADTLSGGQQQRVAIARALVQESQLILADEPIASLDPHNATRVMTALRAINREDGITVICNLHTLGMARTYCDRIIGMARGRVVFDSPAAALTAAAVREVYGAGEESAEVFAAAESPGLRMPSNLDEEPTPTAGTGQCLITSPALTLMSTMRSGRLSGNDRKLTALNVRKPSPSASFFCSRSAARCGRAKSASGGSSRASPDSSPISGGRCRSSGRTTWSAASPSGTGASAAG